MHPLFFFSRNSHYHISLTIIIFIQPIKSVFTRRCGIGIQVVTNFPDKRMDLEPYGQGHNWKLMLLIKPTLSLLSNEYSIAKCND